MATALANAEARAELQRLADEQAALRRVATLAAEAAGPAAVFDAVVNEVARVLGCTQVGMMRAEGPDEAVIVAHRGQKPGVVHVGMRLPLVGDSVTARVLRTGRSTRMNITEEGEGPIVDLVRRAGTVTTVGAAITVEGRIWASSPPPGPRTRYRRSTRRNASPTSRTCWTPRSRTPTAASS